MATSSNPIDPDRFATALESLPLDSLHAKAAELRNNIAHLKSSNDQMLPFADEGDDVCKDAMLENLTVIGRLHERIGMLRAEVEKRGMRWSEGEVEDAEAGAGGAKVNGDVGVVNGTVGGAANGTSRGQSRRLTDEQLRRQLEARMAEDDEDGVHL